MNPTDAAWAAGFLDGEGCVSVVRCTHKGVAREQVQVLVDAAQVKPEPLRKLAVLFGGTVRFNPRQQGIYTWRVYGRKAGVVLTAVLPYLVGKRRQAELCLELLSLQGGPGQRRSDAVYARALGIAEELRGLNQRRTLLHAERLSESAPQGQPLRMVR